jgi:hypothetical protein
MEPEGSSLCSQEPETGPYPEPDKSNPQPYNFVRLVSPRSGEVQTLHPGTLATNQNLIHEDKKAMLLPCSSESSL